MATLRGQDFKDRLTGHAKRYGIINEVSKQDALVIAAFWEPAKRIVKGSSMTYVPADKPDPKFGQESFDRLFSYQTIILQRNTLKTYGLDKVKFNNEVEKETELTHNGAARELIPLLVLNGEVTIGNDTDYSTTTRGQQNFAGVHKADIKVDDVSKGEGILSKIERVQRPEPEEDLDAELERGSASFDLFRE